MQVYSVDAMSKRRGTQLLSTVKFERYTHIKWYTQACLQLLAHHVTLAVINQTPNTWLHRNYRQLGSAAAATCAA
jgi:hypothetical protein